MSEPHDPDLFSPTLQRVPLAPGLHMVSTPIGAARDITLRALDVLAGADVLAAEDTRSLRRLMEIHGVRLGDRPLLAYHDHNGAEMRPRILSHVTAGKVVAYASEAGTPLVADPGFQLARAVIDAGHRVWSAPGASAVLSALTVGGLPSDRFCFAGFLPASGGARKTALREVLGIPATLVLCESPKRIHRLLDDLCEEGAGERQGAICRELTKRFEDIRRGAIADLRAQLQGETLKGEIVVLIDRASEAPVADEATVDQALRRALASARLRDAVDLVSAELGVPRRDVYQRALAVKDSDKDG